ncbi:acyltransferase family protein [Mesorhizobium muleiense]|uniref:acyltransferase family protein n=1 Tax=Mesorhizobium muleiense TaxID=1004279 RepID=UPI003AFB5DC3
MDTQRSAITPLTSLRFFAAIYVLVFHSGSHLFENGRWPEPITNLLRNGYLGVSFFFVLSGFILTYSYAGRLKSAADLKVYGLGRFARIYPLYALALILWLPISAEPYENGPLALATVFMVQSWGAIPSPAAYFWNMPAWTLSVEVFFYLLFPLALAATEMLKGRSLWAGFGFTAVIVVVLGIPALGPVGDHILRFEWMRLIPLPVLKFAEFLLGVFAARLFLFRAFTILRFDIAGVLIAGATIGVLMASREVWAASLSAICFTGIIVAAAANEGRIRRSLSFKPLVLLGSASYAIYLLQTVVRAWIRVLFTGDAEWLGRAIYQPVLIAIAILAFLYIEEPARRHLKPLAVRSA